MSEKKEIPPLNPIAFVVAMICGPLLVTLCTFWMAFIPVYALVFGGIPYLVVGTPLALLMALTGPVTAGRAALWGCMTVISVAVPAAAVAGLMAGSGNVAFVVGLALICAIFAAGWAATSGWIYRSMITPKPKPN